jgi:hypothetical protein
MTTITRDFLKRKSNKKGGGDLAECKVVKRFSTSKRKQGEIK